MRLSFESSIGPSADYYSARRQKEGASIEDSLEKGKSC